MSNPNTRYVHLRWPFFFSWNTVGPTPLTSLSVVNSCIEGTVVKCCNGIAEGIVPTLTDL
jgi:hypothetical protein